MFNGQFLLPLSPNLDAITRKGSLKGLTSGAGFGGSSASNGNESNGGVVGGSNGNVSHATLTAKTSADSNAGGTNGHEGSNVVKATLPVTMANTKPNSRTGSLKSFSEGKGHRRGIFFPRTKYEETERKLAFPSRLLLLPLSITEREKIGLVFAKPPLDLSCFLSLLLSREGAQKS